jgi:hypothetical protein
MDDKRKTLLNLMKTNRNSFYKFFLKNEGYNPIIQKILDKMDEESCNIPSDLLIRWICKSYIFPDDIIKNSDGFLNTENIHKFVSKLTYLFAHFKSRLLYWKQYSPQLRLNHRQNSVSLLFMENKTNWGFIDTIDYIKFHFVLLANSLNKPYSQPIEQINLQPTWTASIFLTCPAVNTYQDVLSVSFIKYFFPIIVNTIAFFEIFPRGSVHLMYDPEGAFQSNVSNVRIGAPPTPPEATAATPLSSLQIFLQILLFHQSQFNDYEETLIHKTRLKLLEIIYEVLAEIPHENITFEQIFIYLLNKSSPTLNQLRIYRYTVSDYFRTKDGYRLGTNLKKRVPVVQEVPENSKDISGNGFIGQSMRFFFLRQRPYIFQEKKYMPPSYCLFMDAHTFGFCTATRQIAEAFRENYLQRRNFLVDSSSKTQYLFGHNYNYSRSWHTPLAPVPDISGKYKYSQKSPICGFIAVIGTASDESGDTPLMSDSDYQETFARLLTFREYPLGRTNFQCDLDYGNDEFLLGRLFQKYADPRQKTAIYFPLHYFYGPHNIFNISQEENEQIAMKRIFLLCYTKLKSFISPTNKLLQIRDIKHYLMNNTHFPDKTHIPFYFKYCVPSHLNFVCTYATSENIVYPYLGTGGSLADLHDDKQVGRTKWKMPDKYIGFKILHDLTLNIHELFFDNVMTTWQTNYILPDKIPAHIQIKTLEDYKRFYGDIFKPIATNSLLPKFLDIQSLRNFRLVTNYQTIFHTRRQVKIKRPLAHTQKKLTVKVVH